MFATTRVLSGYPPTRPLEDQVRKIESPTLLISAGTDVERDFNVLYDEAADGPVEHWNLPGADHTRAIRQHRDEYERRVVSFLDAALAAPEDFEHRSANDVRAVVTPLRETTRKEHRSARPHHHLPREPDDRRGVAPGA